MSDFADATAIHAAITSGGETARSIVAMFRERIEEREDAVRAFRHLDWAAVDRQVERLDALPAAERGPLHGVPVGIKDIFDTADMPTAYGSPIYRDHRPAMDAACVARARRAGAVILGKTVTTEFAYWNAGPTRNPHDTARTPGGSSSGSAAGVAAGFFALALGSQTAASTIRPASYCGIVGFKPTRRWIGRAGVKPLAASLDSIGVFGRSVADVALLAGVLGKCPGEGSPEADAGPPKIAIWKGSEYDRADPCARKAVEGALASLEARGATAREVVPKGDFATLTEAQTLVMAFEAAYDLAAEHLGHADALSDPLRTLLQTGDAISADDYLAATTLAQRCRRDVDALFGGADLLVAPSTFGEAPRIEDGTGSPDMSRAWTLLDLPSLTLSVGTGPDGLPLGLQIAARPDHDAALLRHARWIETILHG